jgi:AcrR family transcriptional regulator
VPRLWEENVDAHRRAVRDAVVDSAAGLIAEHGLRAVTMTEVAGRAGIGRATLYKYFSDVDGILLAWHERELAAHAQQLDALADDEAPATARLEAVLTALGMIYRSFHGSELAALLHQGSHHERAQQHLTATLHRLLSEGVSEGTLRDDVPVDELVAFCTYATEAATGLPSPDAVHRLVRVTLAGLAQGNTSR